MEKTKNNQIEIYKAENGPGVSVRIEKESVYMTQDQIAVLFGTQRPAITKHLRNIFNSSELREDSVSSILEHTAADGKTYKVKFYNLDVIISVGYRVNSKKATQFRIWATARLKDYLLKGFAINEKLLKDMENLQAKLKDLEGAHRLIAKAIENKRLEGFDKELLKIISDYASTWFLLNQYDNGDLSLAGVSKKTSEALDYEKLKLSIAKFKSRLMQQKQASELFGQENGAKFNAVLGSINQTFDGKELYASMEEKAAHLLYFCVKDHPFTDGNKRIGALMFLLYLVENRSLYNKKGERKVSDNTLTALTLLVAESKPEDKEIMVRLIANLIK